MKEVLHVVLVHFRRSTTTRPRRSNPLLLQASQHSRTQYRTRPVHDKSRGRTYPSRHSSKEPEYRFGLLRRVLTWMAGFEVPGLLPLDGTRWFARHVEHHAVDLRHLVGDPRRDLGQHVIRHSGPVRGHGVFGGDRAKHDRVTIAAAIALHTNGSHAGQQDHRALPDVAVEAGSGQLLTGDRIG